MRNTSYLKTLLTTLLFSLLTWVAQAQYFTPVDINGPAAAGSTVENGNGSYTVTGGGTEFWGDADQGHFAYTNRTADFDVRVRVESLTPANRWTKAGLRLAEDLTPGTEAIFVYVAPADVPTGDGGNGVNNFSTGWRTANPAVDTGSGATGGNHETSAGNPNYPNAWIRMVRVGNFVTTYRANNGLNWTIIENFDMDSLATPAKAFLHPIPSTALFGLAVSSHNQVALPLAATAEFRDYGSPSDPVLITSNPTDRTNLVGQTSTFSFGHAGGFDFLAIQWRTNGVDITDATNATYTTPALTLANSGVTYSVAVSNAFDSSAAISGGALLTVITAPQLTAATTLNNPDAIYLTFDLQMDGTTVLNPANYTVNNGVTVSGVTLWGPGSNGVKLAVSPLAANTTYTVTITGVQDSNGGVIFPNPTAANVSHTVGFGGITLRRYDGSGDFPTVKNKILNCDTPQRYDANLATFEYGTAPQINTTDGDTEGYGAILTGFYVPAATGNHVFGFAADDNAELWLSSDANPANKVLISQQTAWGGSRQFISGDGTIVPLTGNIPLVAGQRYYMEGLFQEGGGGDHMSVAVQTPGGPAIINGTQNLIPSSSFAQLYSFGCPAVYANNLGPVVLVGPGNQSVVENATATFTTVPDGSLPFTAQWYSNGVTIAGATGFTYSFPVQLAANGSVFSVVVNNLFSSATNSSILTVIPAPQMLEASSRLDPSGTNIYVLFSKDMAAAALVPGSYTVDNGVTVSAADFHQGNPRLVRLTVSSLTAGVLYAVTGTGITDPDSNLLNPNPTTRTFTHLSAPGVNAPVGLVLKRYNGANTIGLVRNAINNCTAPNFTDVNQSVMSYFPNLDNYGTWMYGMFAPPTTGNYQFQVQGDDNVQLFLSTDELPANKVLIASQTAWGSTRDYAEPNQGGTVTAPSAMIPLVAGRLYYLELLHQEGGGGDHVQATVRLPGGPAIVDNAPDISRDLFATNSSFGCPPQYYFNFGPVSLTQQPVDVTVNELFPATFTTKLDGSPSYAIQWYSNNVPVPGATAASYSFSPLRYANGAQYHMIVNNGFSSATSAVVTLTVISDEVPPAVVNVLGAPSRIVIGIIFSEPLTLLQATNPANYVITNAAGVVLAHSLSVLPEVSADGKSVTLRTDPQVSGAPYGLVLNNLTDRAGVPNVIAADTVVPFTASDLFYAPGAVVFRAYPTGGGNAIAELTNHPSYLNNMPDYEQVIFSMNSRTAGAPYNSNGRENYGGGILGHFIPPVSGNWIFYISSDDDGLLLMNTNGPDSSGKAPVRFAPGCCRALSGGSDPTVPITLLAGQAYYIEALYKEGGGGDYVEVAARLQGALTPLTVIGSGNLAFASRLTITQDPTNLTVIEGQNASFYSTVSVAGAGAGSQRYQWQRSEDNTGASFTNIPGATAAAYTFRAFDLDNQIQFRVVAALPGLQTNVSSAATLTVLEDLILPTLLSVRVGEDRTKLFLTYSEAMSPNNASDPSNFYLDQDPPGAATLREVNGAVITLTFSQPLAPNTPYVLTGDGQTDEFNNATDPATTVTPVFIYQPFGLNHRYSFRNTAGPGGGATVLDSVGGAHGTVQGAGTTFTGDRVTLPGGASATEGYVDLPNGLLSTNAASNGGSGEVTIEGWVKVTGARTWARIFDFGSSANGEVIGAGGGGEGTDYLFYSGQEDNNVNRRVVSFRDIDPAPDGTATGSGPGVGFDTVGFNTDIHFVITWSEVSQTMVIYENGVQKGSFGTGDLMKEINDVNVWLGRSQWNGDQNLQGEFDEFRIYNRIITAEERAFNLAVGPNNTFDAPLAVRVVVPSTTMGEGSSQQAQVFADFASASNVNLTATRTFTLISDDPSLVAVSPSSLLTAGIGVGGVANLVATFSGVASTPLAITVVQDTTKPTVVSVNGTRSLDSIKVVFSEAVNPTQAQEPTNYILTDTNTNPVNFGTPVLGGDGRTVTIPVTGGHLPGAVFVLDISGIADLAGAPNTMDATNFTFQTWIWSRGFAIADYYLGINGGLIADLTNNPAYPNSPGLTEYVSVLESRANWNDNYGVRISGRLRAPRTANYHFFIGSDDEGAIYLSTDLDPANRVQIATEPQWSGGREFVYPSGDCCGRPGNYRTNNPPYLPVNIASNIALTAGSSYYIEALAKEGGGGDNLAVAWQFPGSPVIVNGSEPIQGSYLSSLADPVGASITVVTQPQSTNIWYGQSLILSVAAVGTNVNGAAPVSYQWQRRISGVWTDIVNAHSANFPINPVPPGLNEQYRALIFIPGAETVSDTATVLGVIAIAWPGPPDILQEADEVTGPWTDLVAPSNPFIVIPGDAPKKFYKLKQLP